MLLSLLARRIFAFRRGGERERVGGVNRGREFRGKPKTGELRVVIYDSSDGKTSEVVLMLEVICFESCYALFRTAIVTLDEFPLIFSFFRAKKSNYKSPIYQTF